MNLELEKVSEFHRTAHHPIKESPVIDDVEMFKARAKFIKEEVEEYLEACRNNNIVGVADALSDILYFTYGTVLVHGLQNKMEDIFNEVHNSNMSKFLGNKGPLFDSTGKVIKGPNYKKPKIKEILEK